MIPCQEIIFLIILILTFQFNLQVEKRQRVGAKCEKEIDNDLFFGSRMNLWGVFSIHTMTVVEGNNFIRPDYPERMHLILL